MAYYIEKAFVSGNYCGPRQFQIFVNLLGGGGRSVSGASAYVFKTDLRTIYTIIPRIAHCMAECQLNYLGGRLLPPGFLKNPLRVLQTFFQAPPVNLSCLLNSSLP